MENFIKILLNILKKVLGNMETNKNIIIEKPTLEKEVNIKIDTTIRKKYKKGWAKKGRKKPIIEIVIHGTAGGSTTSGLLNWMMSGARAKKYNRGIGLFHYTIGRVGNIVEVIDPNYWVYHSTSGNNDKQTIGIELLNPDKNNEDAYTSKQYKSLFDLIFNHLLPIYPSITRITSHRYNILTKNKKSIAKKYDKNCPGNFDWFMLDKELKKQGYTFKVDGNLRFTIRKY